MKPKSGFYSANAKSTSANKFTLLSEPMRDIIKFQQGPIPKYVS